MKDIFKTFGIGLAYATGITAGFIVGSEFVGKKMVSLAEKLTKKKQG